MTKLFSLLAALLILLQLFRPIGLPGLRHRSDCWKLAAIALLVFGLTALIRP